MEMDGLVQVYPTSNLIEAGLDTPVVIYEYTPVE